MNARVEEREATGVTARTDFFGESRMRRAEARLRARPAAFSEGLVLP